ncbi:MAG TPA: arginine--tRNA ligase [Candidatus Saccharimonadales bacterium]|jgi:arginyl-tRNA synthetase|nr:arginine--tRNA ligase [Candidatus Saccharimonadales bacterium]
MKERLEKLIAAAARDLFSIDTSTKLTRPDENFGDYATNVALQIAPQLEKTPREIADQLQLKLTETLAEYCNNITIAGPGFINIKLKDSALWDQAKAEFARTASGQKIVIEYSDPNPFKILHAGHLYTSVVGDAVANLLDSTGAAVHRVNFSGDVGLHVAKTIWAILFYESDGKLDSDIAWQKVQSLADKPLEEKSNWLSGYYIKGNAAYVDDQNKAKDSINDFNQKIYKIFEVNDHNSSLAQIYWTCRGWSYGYFDKFYERIGSHFEKYYPESGTIELGLKTVREHIGDVFKESDGAVVFNGEDHGLHTRVFITSQGLPTYETKDIGLLIEKWQDYHFNRSIVITANEQAQYMAVVLKAIEQFAPELAKASQHITHGSIRLQGNVKMGSRLGNIIRATEVLDSVNEANTALNGKKDDRVVLGAVKYAFLKQRLGGDIIFDPAESVSLEGNSGPYLQYAYVRAASMLSKTESDTLPADNLQADERKLLLKIGEFQEVQGRAVNELLPHHVCTYLYELAQTFNQFYEGNRVIGNDREAIRVQLVRCYARTLKTGLELLGIPVIDKM